MDRFVTLKIFFAVLLLGSGCRCWKATVQQSVTAIKGTCVLVPCSTDPYSKVTWYKYKSIGYPVVYSTDRSEIIAEFKGRTSVPGNAQEGNCTLRIENVQQQDGTVSLYVWIWKPDGQNKGFYDQSIEIKVLEPMTPQISVESPQIKGKTFTATCKFHYSCPSSPPQMSWLGLQSISNVLRHTYDKAGLWVTEATATFNITNQDQAAFLSCKSILNRQALMSSSVSLNVLYAPTEVKIDYAGSNTVMEGKKISLRCTSNSKPLPTLYEWLVTQNNTTTTTSHKGSTVVLQDVRRRTSVSCIVTNSIGRTESKQLSLNVHYAPADVRVDYEGSSAVVEGKKILLRCASDSSPVPTLYEWLVTRNNTTIHYKGSTLVLQDVMRDTSVSCIATNSVGRGESKKLSLSVHYSPSILPSSFCSITDGTLRCVCQADANPNAVISWTVDGSSALFPSYNTSTQRNGSMMVSELTGPKSHNVICTATNDVATEIKQIHVHSEGNASSPGLVAGVAVVAVVSIVLGLVVIAIKIWKKRSHAEPHENLNTAQHMTPGKKCHEYCLNSDEDLYVNTVQGQPAYQYEDQEAESCIYANYDTSS
ncbi:myelin-associated glycoprotein-like isoform X2 [Neoarius graeffei]|nr:myelin-associated glycoprotein-like isoform X2 [Neoarius graeffei]XP_060756945.1 myelin-associated glycoprotein-like isoform X2 [Neoarius graeffei]XP_060756946.1 myelin-associated glycoprotein-like isoform X2 [Neoarius graeffei]